MKILVVDDQTAKYLQVEPMLSSLFPGSKPRHARTFLAAVRLLDTYPWDLVILDMAFSVNDAPSEDAGFEGQAGLQVLQHMHRTGITTKVIIFTAQPQFDGSDHEIGNIDALKRHVKEFFGDLCLGCIYSKKTDREILIEMKTLCLGQEKI